MIYKLHLSGLALRILELMNIKLIYDMEKIDLLGDEPFLPHYLEIPNPHVQYSAMFSPVMNFLFAKGEYYENKGGRSHWFMKTGWEMDLAIYFHR